MILISLSDELYASSLEKELTQHNAIVHRVAKPELAQMIHTLKQNYTCVVADESSDHIESNIWKELIKSWARCAKIFLYPQPSHHSPQPITQKQQGPQSDEYHHLCDEDSSLLYTKINSSPAGLAEFICHDFSTGPSWFFQGHTPSLRHKHLEALLKAHKKLYLFYVDGSKHRNIYTEYGVKVHAEFHRFFEQALYSAIKTIPMMNDHPVVYKKDTDSNIYYIFCTSCPSHQKLCTITDYSETCYQLFATIDQHLKQNLAGDSIFKDLLHFQKKVASFSVGYSSTLYNRCFSLKDQLKLVTSRAKQHADMLHHWIRTHEREFLINLISREDVLYPKYQAIFKIADINEHDLATLKARQYHKLTDKIYGFESLIRVHAEQIQANHDHHISHINPHDLNPLTLFAIAYRNNLSLELDQKCISLAIRDGSPLIGMLLVNIFPRNFYYIDKLSNTLPQNTCITFEISEEKVIKNNEFLLEARTKLNSMNFKVAVDDMSSGFSNLQRLFTIKPDLIKLDLNLIHKADQSTRKQLIIRFFVECAQTFSQKVLVEGVETRAEFEICKELGVDYVQGFFLHKPDHISNIIQEFRLDPQPSSSKDSTQPDTMVKTDHDEQKNPNQKSKADDQVTHHRQCVS